MVLWLHHFLGVFLLSDAAAFRFFPSCNRLPFFGATSSLIIVVGLPSQPDCLERVRRQAEGLFLLTTSHQSSMEIFSTTNLDLTSYSSGFGT